jgi:hypothetical protein
MLIVDGYDEAIIGQTSKGLVVYDASIIVSMLMEDDGMDEEEAMEYFYYNIDGSYMGEETPIFVFLGEVDV